MESPLPRRTPSMISSTPPPTASPATSRHLKRLSLSTSSSSISSQASLHPSSSNNRLGHSSSTSSNFAEDGAAATTATSPHTPNRTLSSLQRTRSSTNARHGHGHGHAAQDSNGSSSISMSTTSDSHDEATPRSSTSSSSVDGNDIDPESRCKEGQDDQELTPQASTSMAQKSQQRPAWNFPSPIANSSTSAPSSAHAPRTFNSTNSTNSTSRSRSGAHPTRRGTSISYSSSSALIGSAESYSGVGLGYSNFPGSPIGYGSRGNGVPHPSSMNGLGLGLGMSIEENEDDLSEMEGTTSSIASGSPNRTRAFNSFLSPSRSGSAITGSTRPTLTEQNADLLSFIAKKERKCLDLREELKRHDAELKSLKTKWESIVAKSLHSPTAPPTPVFSSTSTRSANSSSDVHLPKAARHSLDLGLLASTFDTPGSDFSSDPGLDVMHAASASSSTLHHAGHGSLPNGIHGLGSPDMGESVQAARAWVGGVFGKVMSTVDETLMTVVGAHPPVGHHSSSTPSTSSSASTSTSSASPMTSPEMSGLGLGLAALKEEEEEEEEGARQDAGPTATISNAGPHHRRGSSTSSSISSSIEGTHSPGKSAKSYQRPRTTLDVLSSGWGNMSKRLSTVNFQETLATSKKAASGLVDSFEQGLVSALGPLELPPLADDESARRTDENQGPTRTTSVQVGGYRRPSKMVKDHPKALKETNRTNLVFKEPAHEEVVGGDGEPDLEDASELSEIEPPTPELSGRAHWRG